MAADENRSEVPGAPADDDNPDWTTWLRSRLERVVTSERKGADGLPEPAAAPDSEGAGATTAPAPARIPAPPVDRGDDGAVAELKARVDTLVDAVAGYRALAEEQGATSERLAAWMQELATTQADDERWAVAVSRVLEEVDDERREAGERTEATLAALSDRVGRIEEGLAKVSTEIANLHHRLSAAPVRGSIQLGEAQLRAVAARIAATLATRSASALPAPEPVPVPGAEATTQPVASERADNGAGPPRRRPRRTSPLRAAPPGEPTTRGA